MKYDPEQISTPPDGKPLPQQPAWRRDFPIDVPEDNYIARRDFTKFLVLTSGAFVAGQACIAAKAVQAQHEAKSNERMIARLADLPVGGALTFTYPEEHDTCILLRPDEKTVLAYSQKCTHLSCAVVPDKDRNCLHCPCHEGNFDMATGKPISGPPRRPLPRIHVEVRGDEIWATQVEVRMV
jgi:nitrite reductase/ring-hydroxylating ferredoxin subunit